MKRSVLYFVFILFFGMFVFAYTQDIFSPGHGGDQVYLVVNGNEMSLQDAIDSGNFSSEYTGSGGYSGDIGKGHNADEVFVNIDGNDKSFQEGINDRSLCLFGGGAVSRYSGSDFVGHEGGEFLINLNGEKSLQEAIDAGDFAQNVWLPSRADTCSDKTVDQTRCGESRTVVGTKSCVSYDCTPCTMIMHSDHSQYTLRTYSGSSLISSNDIHFYHSKTWYAIGRCKCTTGEIAIGASFYPGHTCTSAIYDSRCGS